MQVVGKAFTSLGAFTAYVRGLRFGAWRPRFVVVHNTGAPDAATYAGYIKRGLTDERWMGNLKSYYEGLGWSAGPHLFVTPRGICVFSPLTARGTHSPSWNGFTWGVETVGDFNKDPFSGPVKSNLVGALAVLHLEGGLRPAPFALGSRGLHFHKEDVKTTHRDCPGKNMDKAALVSEVVAKMDELAQGDHQVPETGA